MSSSALERPAQARRRSGVLSDRVAGDRDQRADLALARASRSPRRGTATGSSPKHLRQAAHAALPAAELARPCRCPGVPRRVRRARGGLREHRAARAVEVAGQHVEHVDEPARERAELLRAGADAAVDGGALGARPARARCAGSRRRRCRRRPRRASGVKSRGERLDLVEPVGVLGEPARIGRAPRRTARCTSANSRSASVPGRMKWCSSASSAVRLRRGSITTTLPPRSRMRAQPARACRAPSTGCRSRPAGWRQHQQVVGAVDVGDRDAEQRCRTSARPRRAWASGRPCVAEKTLLRAERLQRTPARRAARRGCARSGCRGRRATASRPCCAEDRRAGGGRSRRRPRPT